MARYQEAFEMPRSAFLHEGVTLEQVLGRGYEYTLRRSARLGVAKCLIKLERLDEAQSLLDEMEEDRLNLNMRASEEGLDRMRRWHWHQSDTVYWMLRNAWRAAAGGPPSQGRK